MCLNCLLTRIDNKGIQYEADPGHIEKMVADACVGSVRTLKVPGAKSYGRAPTFLAMTGFEQVRSVVAEISGDHEAAARVELELPDTGVCGGAGIYDAPDDESQGGCCGSAAPTFDLTVEAAR